MNESIELIKKINILVNQEWIIKSIAIPSLGTDKYSVYKHYVIKQSDLLKTIPRSKRVDVINELITQDIAELSLTEFKSLYKEINTYKQQRKRATVVPTDTIREMVKAGKTTKEISEITGIAISTINSNRKRMGIAAKRKTPQKRKVRKQSNIDKNTIITQMRQGLKDKEIAAFWSVTRQSIQGWRKRLARDGYLD